MEKRKLGNSDLLVTAVGYGAWAIGGTGWQFAWGPQKDVGARSRAQAEGVMGAAGLQLTAEELSELERA